MIVIGREPGTHRFLRRPSPRNHPRGPRVGVRRGRSSVAGRRLPRLPFSCRLVGRGALRLAGLGSLGRGRRGWMCWMDAWVSGAAPVLDCVGCRHSRPRRGTGGTVEYGREGCCPGHSVLARGLRLLPPGHHRNRERLEEIGICGHKQVDP
jgi:hypothetical protein